MIGKNTLLVLLAQVTLVRGTVSWGRAEMPGKDLLVQPYKIQFKTLKYDPPLPARHVRKNGTVVHLLEDHELPVVRMYAHAFAGYYLLPPEKAGIDDVFGSVMRTGGTTHISGD